MQYLKGKQTSNMFGSQPSFINEQSYKIYRIEFKTQALVETISGTMALGICRPLQYEVNQRLPFYFRDWITPHHNTDLPSLGRVSDRVTLTITGWGE